MARRAFDDAKRFFGECEWGDDETVETQTGGRARRASAPPATSRKMPIASSITSGDPNDVPTGFAVPARQA